MKKRLLFFIICLCTVFSASAQSETPLITLKATPGNVNFEIYAISAGQSISIDWGNGTKINYDNIATYNDFPYTVINSEVTGDGTIKIYGEDIIESFESIFLKDGAQISEADINNATQLKKITIQGHALSGLDISKNVNLTSLSLNGNGLTVAPDLSNNTELTSIDLSLNALKSLNVSKNEKLGTLKCNDNQLTTIDLSKNTELKYLYIGNNLLTTIDLSNNTLLNYLSLPGNLLTKLDVTAFANLATLFCDNNFITELKIPATLKTRLSCKENYLTLATLPAKVSKFYVYAPQRPMRVMKDMEPGSKIDLNAQNGITGTTESAQTTTFTWKYLTSGETLAEGTDYTAENNVFTFPKELTDSVYCEMASDAFPDLSGANAFKTNNTFIGEYPLLITLKASDIENNVNLTLLANEPLHGMCIDWGNGTKTPVKEISADAIAPTQFSQAAQGDGTIKIYAGDNITEFDCGFSVGSAKITALDVTKATALTRLSAETNSLTSIDLSKNTALYNASFNSNQIKTIDITNNAELQYFECVNNGLTELKISENNAKLSTLKCNNNSLSSFEPGKLTNLKNLYIGNNQLTTIDLSANKLLSYVQLTGNKLTSLDVSECPKLATVFCNNNMISDLKIAPTLITNLNCSGNRLTLATLPTKVSKNYTYAPQAALTIQKDILTDADIDLSAQDNVTGIATEPQTTVYTWKVANDENTVLVKGTDYTENNGVFTFLKAPSDSIYCEMSTPAFTAFNGKNIFKTTNMLVTNVDGIDATDVSTPILFSESGVLYINNIATGTKINVVNAQGALMDNRIATETTAQFYLPQGIYIITIDGKSYKTLVK
ncbi:DUF6383 domain-containing protein [Coprobacter tertius]|uniref:DUF6383 domain-containing protein n=1 Tax=Coprobacter tertius TaxID=2944915 RepID=A0ABT1MID7_9BACT|nr:DUF6383 domain-containing protein [Coprobacter tertius]MCP9610986.1 DUF6383 domain-containing protein [Coprobacter tertius]